MKRLFDVIASLSGLIILAPVFVGISLVLTFVGERRVLYRQQRIGRYGVPFEVLKFTTMFDNVADRPDGGMAVDTDPEVFPFGRFLRRSKLNELPQLFNVLSGEMSVVGPRPLTTKTLAKYEPTVRKRVLNGKPGLTGAASLVFRDEEQILAKAGTQRAEVFDSAILPQKQLIEAWYATNASFLLDMRIIVATAIMVVFPSSPLPARLVPQAFALREVPWD